MVMNLNWPAAVVALGTIALGIGAVKILRRKKRKIK
jgi:hypothetical protein